jgi:hypothetical protein
MCNVTGNELIHSGGGLKKEQFGVATGSAVLKREQ